MKVIFITYTLRSGGAERVISILSNKLSKQGWNIEIICLGKHRVFYDIYEKVKITFADEHVLNDSLFFKFFWLRNYIKRSNPDAVVPFMIAVYSFTILALFGTKVRIIPSERNDPRSYSLLEKFLRIITIPFSTHVVVQTGSIKALYPKFIRNKTSVIFNPVNDGVFNQSNYTKDKCNVIISVARYEKQKNQRMLIASFEKVHTYHPEYELHIYGEGSLEDELSEEIRKRGLENAIFLKGKTTKVLEKMSSARIFCLSSDYEGMSNSMIEAICMGLPVITTKVSGTEELIQNGINGYVTPIGDVEKFASCLNILMSNGDLVHKMSENNKLMAYKFSADKIVEQWKKLIYQIVKENN